MGNDLNPYQPSNLYSPASNANAISAPSNSLPGFCLVIFITSLVLCIIRVFVVALSILGLLFLARNANGVPQGSWYMGLAVVDVIVGLGISLLGITANSLLLLKKGVGLYLGYALAFFVAISLGVAVINICLMFRAAMEGGNLIPMLIGAGGAMAIRFALAIAYLVGLQKFRVWYRSTAELLANPQFSGYGPRN